MKRAKSLYRVMIDKWIREAEKKPFLSLRVHDGYWIGWFFAVATYGLCNYDGRIRFLSGLATGVNLGMGIEKFFHLKFKAMMERSRRQDLIEKKGLN